MSRLVGMYTEADYEKNDDDDDDDDDDENETDLHNLFTTPNFCERTQHYLWYIIVILNVLCKLRTHQPLRVHIYICIIECHVMIIFTFVMYSIMRRPVVWTCCPEVFLYTFLQPSDPYTSVERHYNASSQTQSSLHKLHVHPHQANRKSAITDFPILTLLHKMMQKDKDHPGTAD